MIVTLWRLERFERHPEAEGVTLKKSLVVDEDGLVVLHTWGKELAGGDHPVLPLFARPVVKEFRGCLYGLRWEVPAVGTVMQALPEPVAERFVEAGRLDQIGLSQIHMAQAHLMVGNAEYNKLWPPLFADPAMSSTLRARAANFVRATMPEHMIEEWRARQ